MPMFIKPIIKLEMEITKPTQRISIESDLQRIGALEPSSSEH